MTLREAETHIIQECRREKKITIRNLIVIAIGLLIVIVFCLNISASVWQKMGEALNLPPFVKWLLPLIGIGVLLYPAMHLWKVLQRKKKVDTFFAQLKQGAEARITGETENYLTVIPLWNRLLKFDRITRIQAMIDTQRFELPVYPYAIAEVKRALSNTHDKATYTQVMDELYNKKEETTHTAETIKLQSAEAFHTWAEQAFGNELNQMEQGRTTDKRILYLQIAFAVAEVIAIWYIFLSGQIALEGSNIVLVIGGLSVATTLLYGLLLLYKKKRASNATDYTQLKSKIFGRVVKYIHPDFEYIEKGHIGIGGFISSLLFEWNEYSLTGSDQIVGYYNGIPFQSSNIWVTFRPALRPEKQPDDVVFCGNFFIARSPKTFEHPIVIHPVKGFFGELKNNDITNYLNYGGEKIRLEDPDFRRQFEVRCDDQITARYVLTPAFMERLKKLNQRNKGQVYIAINKDNIVIATNRSNALMQASDDPTAMLFQKIDLAMIESVYSELVAQLEMIDTITGKR